MYAVLQVWLVCVSITIHAFAYTGHADLFTHRRSLSLNQSRQNSLNLYNGLAYSC